MIAILALTGCWLQDATYADGGPLGSDGYGMQCIRDRNTGEATLGMDAVHNRTGRPLTVQAVKLLDSRGFVLKEAYLVPITGTNLMGDTARFPPDPQNTKQRGVHWDRRVLIGSGTPIDPDPSTYNVALHLVQTTRNPRLTGFEIDYTTHTGARYRWQTHISLEIRATCA